MNSCSRVASTNVAVIITQDDVSTQFCTFEFDQNELVVCLLDTWCCEILAVLYAHMGLRAVNPGAP